MAMPAFKLEPATLPEERLGRLEVNVEHLRADMSQIKIDIREVRQEIHSVRNLVAPMELKMASLELKMIEAIHLLKVGRMADRVGMLLMGAAILGVMARGFGWL